MAKRNFENAFIHEVTPIKKAAKSECQYYKMFIQTKDSDNLEVLSYNTMLYPEAQKFANVKSPVKIKYIRNKDQQMIFNDACSIREIHASDIDFCYKPLSCGSKRQLFSTSDEVMSIKSVCEVNAFDWKPVAVNGVLSFGGEPLIEIKTQYGLAKIKKDCVLEDETGIVQIQLYESTFKGLVNKRSYKLTAMMPKTFKTSFYLASTRGTRVEDINDETFQDSQGELYLTNLLIANQFSLLRTIGSVGYSLGTFALVVCPHAVTVVSF